MSSNGIHAPNLKASKNKSHHNRFACQRTFQHIYSIVEATLCPIYSLMQLVSLKTQNMEVVELFLMVP